MRINSAGKIGIGTNSPVEILHIKEDTNKNLHFTGGIGQIGNVTGFYAVNDAKWKNAIEFCKDRNMEFIIITEDELKV